MSVASHRARLGALHPRIVHLTVATPYPGHEIWHTEQRKLATLDYRLFDIQHAVRSDPAAPSPLLREARETQRVLNRKHLAFPR